jgi:hypothetical protein
MYSEPIKCLRIIRYVSISDLHKRTEALVLIVPQLLIRPVHAFPKKL